jgi:FkbM family methyltransferase
MLKNTAAYRKTKRFLKQLIGEDVWTKVQFDCEKKIFGADWCICPVGITKDSIVYSFGVGDDISFDQALIDRYDLSVFAFDPTPNSVEWVKSQNTAEKFQFYPYGLSDDDGTIKLFPRVTRKGKSKEMFTMVHEGNSDEDALELPVHRLKTIQRMLNQDHIDIIKMDIEAAEYSVIDDLIECGISAYQILVEFHHRFDNVEKRKTLDAISKLNKAGYYIFFISQLGREYSFINKSLYLEKTACR